MAFARIVKELTPKFIILENVKSVTTMYQGQYKTAILKSFSDLGYEVNCAVLNAADYGVPQVRQRAFFVGTLLSQTYVFPKLRRRLLIVGNRTGHIVPWPKKKFFSQPKEWQDAYRTVGEVIFDLAEESSYRTQTNHIPMNHKPLLVERYHYIPEGGKLDNPTCYLLKIRQKWDFVLSKVAL